MSLSKQLSLYEISTRTGIAYTALCKAIKSGDLRGYKLTDALNSPYYVSESDVEDWIERRKLATQTDKNRHEAS